MMVLGDRDIITLICNLYFASVAMLQRRKSKRASEDKIALNLICHLSILKTDLEARHNDSCL
jgi:hypothetical protein